MCNILNTITPRCIREHVGFLSSLKCCRVTEAGNPQPGNYLPVSSSSSSPIYCRRFLLSAHVASHQMTTLGGAAKKKKFELQRNLEEFQEGIGLIAWKYQSP